MKTARFIAFFLLQAALLSGWAAAQVVVDPNAAVGFRPTLGTSPNGVPVVNITNPTAGGVSANQFSSYNVAVNGLILNNSTGTGTSVLGGILGANPNFTGAAALVILNQVTGSSSSNLNGPTEVFGHNAQLIVANPNGISVNGGSFINTSRVTLSTGTPSLNTAGTQVTLQVDGGNISTSGAGLSNGGYVNGTISQLDLVSRTATLDGTLTGVGTVHALVGQRTYNQATGVSTGTGANGPGGITYAFDATALGATQAGQISVVSSDKGVGVRSLGTLASSAGAIQLSADGDITVGNVQSPTDVSAISAHGKVTHQGTASTINGNLLLAGVSVETSDHSVAQVGGTVTIGADQEVTLNGVINSVGDAQIIGDTLPAGPGQITIGADGGLNTQGTLYALTSGAFTQNGTFSANGDINLQAGGLFSQSGVTRNVGTGPPSSIYLTSDGVSLSGLGRLEARHDLEITSIGAVTTTTNTKMDAANNLLLSATGLQNGGIIQAGAVNQITVSATGVTNTSGIIIGGTGVSISGTGNLDNTAGGVIQAGNLGLFLQLDSLNNTDGYIVSAGDVQVQASTGDLNNTRGILESTAGALTAVIANNLTNDHGYILSVGDLQIQVGNILHNQAGTIQTQGNGLIRAYQVFNQRDPYVRQYQGDGHSFDEVETSGPAIIAAFGSLNLVLEDALGAALNRPDGTLYSRASSIEAGTTLTISGASMQNVQDTLDHQRWKRVSDGGLFGSGLFGGHKWVLDYEFFTSTPSPITAGGDIQVNLSGAFVNSSYFQTPANLDIVAASITNGLTDYWVQTAAPKIPPAVISVGVNSLPSPTDALFKVTLNATSPYLVTSSVPEPAQALTPEYLLQQLGIAGQNVEFFADPLYQAQLLHQEALDELGQNFFSNQWSTDNQQTQALYAGLIAWAKAHPNIQLGQALSPDLIAQLNEPLLWYVNQEIDGRNVLTPTVYLPSLKLGDYTDDAGGQIIADNAVLEASGELHNTGYIQITNDLQIAAGSVLNERRTADAVALATTKLLFGSTAETVHYSALQEGGEMSAATVEIGTPGDVTNLGGIILGDNSVNIQAGGNILNEAQRGQFLVNWNRGSLGALFGSKSYDLGVTFTPGQIDSGGTIDLTANNTISNIGSTILGVGDVNLTAQDLIRQDISSATYTSSDGFHLHGFGFSGGTQQTVVTQRSLVESQNGNVNFTSTAGDIHSTGSSINAGQDINLLAKGNVTLDSVSVYGVNKSSSFAFTGNGVGYNQDESNFAKTEQSELSAGNNINVTAGNNILGEGLIAQAGNTISLNAGNDVTLEEHKVNLYDKQSGWTVSLDFPGSDLVHAAFTGGDLGQAALGSLPGGSALEQLINTRKTQDLEANGAQAGLTGFGDLATAAATYNQTGSGLAALGSVSGVGSGGAGGGPSVAVTLSAETYSDETKWTQSDVSQINANNIVINAQHDANLNGGTQSVAQNDLTVSAGNNINIAANADTFSQKSQSEGASVGVSVGASGGEGISVSGNYSQAKAQGTTFENALLQAGNDLTLTSGKDTNISGANLLGDQINLNVGGNLTVASVQDTSNSSSIGGSLGLSYSGAMITPSVSFQESNASSAWTDHATTIEGKDGVTINVNNNTNLIGSQISADNGNLTLNTGSLTYSDLHDYNKSSSFGFSVSDSFGSGGSEGGSFGLNMSNSDKEGMTKATIGAGTITTIKNTDLSNLNRDLTRAQIITEDSHSGINLFVPILSPSVVNQQANQISTALDKVSAQLSGPAKTQVVTIKQIFTAEKAQGLSDQDAWKATESLLANPDLQLQPVPAEENTPATPASSSPTTTSTSPTANLSDMPPPYEDTHYGITMTDEGLDITTVPPNPTDTQITLSTTPVFTTANDLLNSGLYLTNPTLSDSYASQLSYDEEQTYQYQVQNLLVENAANQYLDSMGYGAGQSILSIPQNLATAAINENSVNQLYRAGISLDQAINYPSGFDQYYLDQASAQGQAVYNNVVNSLVTPEGQGALGAQLLLAGLTMGDSLTIEAPVLDAKFAAATAPLETSTFALPLSSSDLSFETTNGQTITLPSTLLTSAQQQEALWSDQISAMVSTGEPVAVLNPATTGDAFSVPTQTELDFGMPNIQLTLNLNDGDVAAEETAENSATSELYTFPVTYQGDPGAMWQGEIPVQQEFSFVDGLADAPSPLTLTSPQGASTVTIRGIDSTAAENEVLTAEQLRNTPGVVMASRPLSPASGNWLSAGTPTAIPSQVADELIGRQFNSFSDLRSAIWQTIGSNEELNGTFSEANLGNISGGNAPFAPTAFQINGSDAGMRFNLHHIEPIEIGGPVYDLGNLQIVSPQLHFEIHKVSPQVQVEMHNP